jgi:hypothetical protein
MASPKGGRKSRTRSVASEEGEWGVSVLAVRVEMRIK